MIIIDDIKNGKKNEQFNAGSKARSDIDQCLNSETIIFMDNSEYKSLIKRSLMFLQSYRTIKKAPKDSIFVIQYPLYMINKYNDILFKYLKDKKTICFIHDINSLRFHPDNIAYQQSQSKSLNQFSVIISHNKKMSAWLKENGCTQPIIELEVFDYLYDDPIEEKKPKYQVSFAGNLDYKKSKFLYKAIKNNPKVSFELFGVGFDETKLNTKNYAYQGSKDPNTLLQCMDSKFGLIWDGDSIETCTGEYGNYERYNNPHKLSMNIAAEIPVIVWKQAAIADFVQKYNIGIVVDSLVDLSTKLNAISEEEYQVMKSNLKILSKKVRSGYYTKKAIQQAVNILKATA